MKLMVSNAYSKLPIEIVAMSKYKIILLLLFIAVSIDIKAIEQDSLQVEPLRPVASAYMLEFGGSRINDTYLTPLKYTGWMAGFKYERMQAMKFNPEKWVMRLSAGVEIDRTQNPAKNADMWYLGLDASWGMMHRWKLPHEITIGAGGSTSLDIGCLYSTRNGNNPASAKAAWTINAIGYVAWNFNVGRLPITVKYQTTLPITGVFFSPDYGELYYEIYLGNDDGLAHVAWWGNYFAMENLLTADLHLSNTCLRIGYRNQILSTKVNDITTRMTTHSVVLGVSGEWISVSPRKGINPLARIISALY